MRFPQGYAQRGVYPSGNLAISGAGAQVNGTAIDSGIASLCVGARVSVTAGTAACTYSVKWQVLDDNGTTWIDCVDPINPGNVTFTTGTAAAVTKMVAAPVGAVAGSRSLRAVILNLTGTPVGGTTDFGSVEYDFRIPVNAFGT